MKKVFIVFIMLTAAGVTGNAQFFVEGDINVSYQDAGTPGNNSKMSQFRFEISPKAGYWLTEHIAVGSNVSYSISNTKFEIDNPPLEPGVSEDIRTEYGLSVFGRYKIKAPKRFSFLLESSLGIRSRIEKEKNDALTKKVGSVFFVDAVIFPAISYDLTDRFSIVAVCDFLSFGLHFSTAKNEDTGQKVHNNVIGFNTGSTIFNSLSNIKLGFIYNF